jgi:hypothetical protein
MSLVSGSCHCLPIRQHPVAAILLLGQPRPHQGVHGLEEFGPTPTEPIADIGLIPWVDGAVDAPDPHVGIQGNGLGPVPLDRLLRDKDRGVGDALALAMCGVSQNEKAASRGNLLAVPFRSLCPFGRDVTAKVTGLDLLGAQRADFPDTCAANIPNKLCTCKFMWKSFSIVWS